MHSFNVLSIPFSDSIATEQTPNPPWGGGRVCLEVEFPGKLNAARRIGAGNRAKTGVTQITVRHEEVGVIEGVEKFHAELDAHVFAHNPVLLEPHIPIDKTRSAKIGKEARRVSEGERIWLRKRRGINPVV